MRWCDVEHGCADDGVRVIAAESMDNTRTTIMPGDHEAWESERLHHLDHILRHCALAVCRVIIAAGGLAAVAVAA
jgi:hypothetical protein